MSKEEQQADTILLAVQSAQQEAAIRNASIRQAERQAKIDAWQDSEAMMYRKALHEKGAIESLWMLRMSGQSVIQPPIPPQHELPKELRGQAPSYVRSMLRDDPKWERTIKAYKKELEDKSKVRKDYPELFGIDYAKLRKDQNVKFGDEHKVRTGKTIKYIEIEPAKCSDEKQKKPGLIARIFAGLKE